MIREYVCLRDKHAERREWGGSDCRAEKTKGECNRPSTEKDRGHRGLKERVADLHETVTSLPGKTCSQKKGREGKTYTDRQSHN